MSYKAQVWAKPIKLGNPTFKAVLNAIAFFADEDGWTFVPQSELAGLTELSDRSVRNALSKLVDLGLLVRVPRFQRDGTRTTDRLMLVLPPEKQLDPSTPSWCLDDTASNGAPFIEVQQEPNLHYGVSPSCWKSLRKQVFARDGLFCTYCGQEANPPHCDHVIPFSKGGKTALDNLTTACAECNVGKKDRSADGWIAIIASRAVAPCVPAAVTITTTGGPSR